MKKKKEMSKNDTKITCFGSICSLISAVYFLTMKFTNGMILFQKEKLIIFHTPHPTLNLSLRAFVCVFVLQLSERA